MKRLSLLCLTLTVTACGDWADTAAPVGEPSENINRIGATVCGMPGENGRVGFSFVDCARAPTIQGKPFGQPVAANASVAIYVDSPTVKITLVESSNPSVGTARVRTIDDGRTVLEVKTLAAGVTKLMVRTAANSKGPIIDQVTLGVVEANEMKITGLPEATKFALLDYSDIDFCVQTLRDGAALVGGGAVKTSSSEGLFVGRDSYACTSGNGLDSATDGQGYSVRVYSPEPQTMTLSLGTVEKTFELSLVQAKDLTDIVIDPPALTIDSKSATNPTFDVRVMAGELPVVGAACTFAETQPSAATFRERFDASPEVLRYRIQKSALPAGRYELSCSLDEGRLQKTLPITVR